MADTKISQLPGYPGSATPSSTDVLPIVDTSSPSAYVSRKIPWSAFTSVAAGVSGTARTGPIKLLAGTGITIVDNGDGSFTINSSGGGGGGFSSASAKWTTANSTSKDAYSNQPTVNNDGITITLVPSGNPGTLSPWTVTLNGVALANTYTASGAYPGNYTITIPAADLSGNSAETATNVTVALSSGSYNLSANNLTNVQPIAFSTALTANYVSTATVPFYTTGINVNWAYSNASAITAGGFNGTITPGGNANAATGTLNNVAISGLTIGGSATGNGTHGAGSSTVTLSGSAPAVPTFVPVFYAQPTSTSSTPPTFTSSSLQTNSVAIGTVLTFATSSSMQNYLWFAMDATYGVSNLYYRTILGDLPLIPDVRTTQIFSYGSGQTKTLYVGGVTSLDSTTPFTLVIK